MFRTFSKNWDLEKFLFCYFIFFISLSFNYISKDYNLMATYNKFHVSYKIQRIYNSPINLYLSHILEATVNKCISLGALDIIILWGYQKLFINSLLFVSPIELSDIFTITPILIQEQIRIIEILYIYIILFNNLNDLNIESV